MKLFTKSKSLILKSFTLIELLIVIVIIGVLSTALIPRIKSIQAQARDTKRISDMRTIQNALEMYHQQYGYLPMTSSYGESNAGSRDYSSQSGFLTFLQTAGILTSVPVDPTNDRSGYGYTGYAYGYYCYNKSWGTTQRTDNLPAAVVYVSLERSFDPGGGQWRLRTGFSQSKTLFMALPVDDCK